MQLLNFRRFSAHEPLAELSLPLGAVDPQHVLERWYQLGPPGTTEVRPLTTGLPPGPALSDPGETETPLCARSASAQVSCASRSGTCPAQAG